MKSVQNGGITTGSNVSVLLDLFADPEVETTTLVHEVINSTGVSYCTEIELEVDSKLEAEFHLLEEQLVNNRLLLSPDGDGFNDQSNYAELLANEVIAVDIELFRKMDNVSMGFISSQELTEGELLNLNWDGRLNGTVVDDGTYYIKITYSDNCLLTESKRIDVIIDTEAPVVDFITPTNGLEIGFITNVVSSVEEANLDFVTIEYFFNNVWNPIPTESQLVTVPDLYEITATLNLMGLPQGTYAVKLYAKDVLENYGETTIDVVLPFEQNIFWSYSLSPLFISPNNDAVQDQATLEVGLNVQSNLIIDVLDITLSTVKQLEIGSSYATGLHQIIWDGTNSTGLPVPDGIYQLRTQAAEIGQPTNTEILSINVNVDNTIPVAGFSVADAAVIKGEGNIDLTVVESHLKELVVFKQSIDPLLPESQISNVLQTGTFAVLSLADLDESIHQLRSTVKDKAGNLTEVSIQFEIDNTAPVISVTTPANLEYVGGEDEVINFTGEITEKNLSSFQLFISPDVEPVQWQSIYTGFSLQENQFNYQWPISVVDGAYLIKLVAIDQAGWEAQENQNITIDKQPPEVEITQPISGTEQGKNITIQGTVNDTNLSYYHLSYQIASNQPNNEWQLIHTGIESVINNELYNWNHNLNSGAYRLRLLAEDGVGLKSETIIEFNLDTDVPETPLYLDAELVGQQDVHLSWNASASNDVIGYWLYKNSIPINQLLITATTFQDLALTEGEFTYWVVAVDGNGNLSLPSNAVTLNIDRTGPETNIQTPENGQVVSGVIAVVGTANSRDDFYKYELYYREQSESIPGVLLNQSTLPVIGQQLAELNTASLIEGANYVVRLEARDLSLNTSVSERSILIDNTSPTAPINLSHQLTGGNDIQLSWNANTESDLAGYLVYRNGVIISGNGSIQSSIITATTYADADVVDGQHSYYVVAVDQAGNISSSSNTVQQTIDTRPPHAYFINPVNGYEFESTIRLEATSDDIDVVSVLFEYSTDAVLWNQILIDLETPFDALFNPTDFALSFGTIYFRVMATDAGAQTDLNPDEIYLEYTDLTSPAAVTGLLGLVTGNDIQLNWSANSEPDLAGYVVYRKRLEPNPQDEFIELTDPVIVENQFLDDSLAEGTYLYRVIAVDSYDNLSQGTESEDLTVFSIQLNQPYSPLLVPAVVDVSGGTEFSGEVLGELDNDSGILELNPAVVNPAGQFVFEDISLVEGDNELIAQQQTIDGHSSVESSVTVQLSPIPLLPLNPLAGLTDFDLSFTWEAPEPTTIGYLPYINQLPVFPEAQLTENLYPHASSYPSSASYVLDGNQQTAWSPSYTDLTNGIPAFVQVLFQGSRWLTQVDIHWEQDNEGDVYQPSQYLLQFSSPVGWITQKDFSGNVNADVSFTANVPYWTEGIRILMPLTSDVYQDIRLSEIEIFYQPLTSQLSYNSTLTDGTYDVQVSAINAYGFESDLTAMQSFVVGDIEPPETVVLSAAVQNGNQVVLNWSASPSVDVAAYRLFRTGNLIMMTADNLTLSYLDVDLPNGSHSYQVRAVDDAGNLSEYSNEVTVEISQQLLDPPTGLSVTAPSIGQLLNLSWDEIMNPDLSHYLVYRSEYPDSGYVPVGQPSINSFSDSGLNNGTRYYYYLTAVDQFGNESLSSTVASGLPLDLIPPDKPVITKPTVSGLPITINNLNTVISGYGSPAVEVDLYQDDVLVDTVVSTHQYSQLEINFNGSFDDIKFNNYGYFAAYDYSEGQVVIVDPESGSKALVVGTDQRFHFWSSNGIKLFVVSGYDDQSELKSYGLDGQEIATLFNGFNISLAAVSVDESQMFYWGDGINPDTSNTEEGLWIYTFDAGVFEKIEVGASIELNTQAIQWLPNGDLAFINSPNGSWDEGELWLQKAQDGSLNVLETNTARESTLTSSSDGSHLYYVVMVNNSQAVVKQRLADGSLQIYAKAGVDVFMPVVNEDVNLVFVNVDCCEKELVNIATGQVIEYFENFGYQQRVFWLDDGRIIYFDYNSVFALVPPGVFEFENVALSPGENQFYAIARKSNGLQSLVSEPIKVSLNEAVLADLEIKPSYLQVIPSQLLSGQSLTGTLLVKNNSSVDVEQARLLIELFDPTLNTQLIAPAPLDFSLSAGGLLAENFTIDNLNALGEYTIRVVVDSNQQVLETNENNNTAVKTIQVIDDLTADIEVSLNTTEVFPGEDLHGLLRVYNPAVVFNGSVVIRITDDEGYPVGFEQSYSLEAINPGSAWEQAFTWNSADYFAGNYLVEASLYNQNQQAIEVRIKSFTVSENAEFSLTLSTFASQIPVNQEVNLLAELKYLFGNVNQSGSLNWQILNSTQQLIWSNTISTSVMSPGFSGSFEESWTASQAGSFQAKVTLVTPLKTESATIPFEVVAVAAQLNLSGLINGLPAGIILGQTWDSFYSIQNNGEIDVTNMPIKLSLWDSQLNQLLAQEVSTISLPIGANSQLLKTWDSNNLTLGSYLLVLSADLSALGESANYLLDTQVVQTVDILGPQVEIINPVDQGYYLPNFEVSAMVNDLHSAVNSVDINLDSNAEVSLPGQQLSNAYQYWLTDLAEGVHQLNVTAKDLYGNTSNQSLTFNVDSILPIIDLTGVSEGGLYNNTVQVNITITEANLSTSQIILDGVPYVSGTPISLEGSHLLMVSATDLAGNRATERVSFNIDLSPPVVIISYPENDSETNQSNTVLVGSTEVGAQVELTNGVYTDTVYADFEGSFSFADIPLTSGQNVISVQAIDLAGNLGQSTSVNVAYVDDIIVRGFLTAQSTYGIGEVLTIAWQITNLNAYAVSQLPVELNLYSTKDNQLQLSDVRNISIGASETVEFDSSFDTVDLNIGDYRIELRVEIDQVWQTLDVDLVLLQDVIGPELTVVEPTEHQVTQASVNLLVLATDMHSQVYEVSYQLDSDINWIPLTYNITTYEGQLDLLNGDHQMVFKAEDSFGNETLSSAIPFTVDTMGPEVVVHSPVDGLITNQAVTIDFTVTDVHAFNVDAQLNQVSTSNGNNVIEEGEYELVIIATDEVSNQSTVTRNFIIDTTPPVVTVTSPLEGTQNHTGITDIIGQAEERNIITITVNGVESTLKTDTLGDFTVFSQVLQVGLNAIVVTATDQAGNVSQPVTRNIEYIEVGSIEGRVWQDDDQDTVIDSGELGFNQVSLKLTDANQISQNVLADSQGYYQFVGLSPGSYTVEVIEADLLNEWTNTTNNNPVLVDVIVDQNIEINFGFYQEKPEIEASVRANNIKGRLLLLLDSPTAQVDDNQCIGVADYQLQRFIETEFSNGDYIWAKLYDNQGILLQSESASYVDFVNNNHQIIDQQPETNEFNLLLHPVSNRQLKASVVSSSTSVPAVLPTAYRLVLGLQSKGDSTEWSGELIASSCQTFAAIGNHSGDLQLADVGLSPPLNSDDPNGSTTAPYLVSQQVMLKNMLMDAGWSYQIVTDVVEFEAEMSSGQYVAYWLMAENVILPTSVQNSLLAVVEEGAGLVVSSGHDNLNTQFYSSMGVEIIGSHLTATQLALTDSVISGKKVLDIVEDEQVLKVSLSSALSAGIFTGIGVNPPTNQAVTWIDRPDGSSVFSGLDWLLQATAAIGFNDYAELIKTVLNYIHPLGLSNELGYARSVKLSLQNSGRPVDGYVQVLLPPSVTLVHSAIPVEPNLDGFRFDYDLLENQLLDFEFWVKVNATPVTLTFEIHLGEDISVYNWLDLTLVAGERPDLSASITNCHAGVKPDQPLTYHYQVTNTGNKEINGALAFTEFDMGLQNPIWSCTGSLGGVCNQSSGAGNLTGHSISLPVGSSVNFMFETQVQLSSPSSILSSGYILMPDEISDINPSNNTAVDYDSVYQFVFKNGFDCATAGQIVNKSQQVISAKEGQ